MDYNAEILKADFIVDARTTLPRHATKKWSRRDPSKLKGIVYHQSLDDYGLAKNNAKYHVGPNHITELGLPGLSYTIFVEKDGMGFLANDIEDVTLSQGYAGHTGDENVDFLGVCFGGNFSGPGYEGPQCPTGHQMNTAGYLWYHLKEIFGWSDEDIYGHFDFGKPACPGYDLMKMIERIRPKMFNSTTERQKALVKLGYYKGDQDGMWGSGCKTALVEFQRAAGLDPDGVWGKKTTAAVRAAMLG